MQIQRRELLFTSPPPTSSTGGTTVGRPNPSPLRRREGTLYFFRQMFSEKQRFLFLEGRIGDEVNADIASSMSLLSKPYLHRIARRIVVRVRDGHSQRV